MDETVEDLLRLYFNLLTKCPPLDENESGVQIDDRLRHGPGYVYLIDDKGTEYFKVGLTGNIERRLKELQREFGDNLYYRVIVKVSDKQAAENDVLSAMRERYEQCEDRGREWFKAPCYKKPIEKWFLEAVKKWSV